MIISVIEKVNINMRYLDNIKKSKIKEIKKKYNISSIDKPSIEDIMLFYIRGER